MHYWPSVESSMTHNSVLHLLKNLGPSTHSCRNFVSPSFIPSLSHPQPGVLLKSRTFNSVSLRTLCPSSIPHLVPWSLLWHSYIIPFLPGLSSIGQTFHHMHTPILVRSFSTLSVCQNPCFHTYIRATIHCQWHPGTSQTSDTMLMLWL